VADLTPAELYIAKKAAAKLSAALKLLSDAKYAIEALPPELLDTLGAPNAVAFLEEVMSRVADARKIISPKPAEEVKRG
jgi:hypothetical protein